MGSYSYGGASRFSFEDTIARIERALASEDLESFGRIDLSLSIDEMLRTGLDRYTLLAAAEADEDGEPVASCVVVVTEQIQGVIVEVTVPDSDDSTGSMRVIPLADGLGARLRHAIGPLLT